ncbi:MULTISPECIES: hypothetical protein [unclassified Sporosarcina]|uniref:hypothetical protein n=1 Tax=unclassified Sporosarcina TaxID=2647733 RepID=UPI00203E89B3|nr:MULTISPECIES: hypothetical protein [unclassified Sporosarcina]GKV66152.1 hypothetical protein NCCP2331_23050 [Sporosarcina sp. NCCP-2331]GLB56240.1 hypothetical protein NCCP2378_20270 [Sporosarcina sp. NCCP-2378]
MFGIFKLLGSPPRAYHYYRYTKKKNEKIILEDLHQKNNDLIKKWDSKITSGDNKELREMRILALSFEDLHIYGTERGYPEYLIALFYKE